MTHSSEIIQMVFFRSLVILLALSQAANWSCQAVEETSGPLRCDRSWLAQRYTRTVFFCCCLGFLFFSYMLYTLCTEIFPLVSSQKLFGESLWISNISTYASDCNINITKPTGWNVNGGWRFHLSSCNSLFMFFILLLFWLNTAFGEDIAVYAQ